MRRITSALRTINVSFPDIVYLSLFGICLILALLLVSINQIFFHFPIIDTYNFSISYFQLIKNFFLVVLCLAAFLYGLSIKSEYPRSSTFFWGYSAILLCIFTEILLCKGIQSTPFSPIDNQLVKIDTWFGFNTLALMTWTHNHPNIHDLLNWMYDFLLIELIFIPVFLVCINARHALIVFLIAESVTLIVGSMIYYFFPTTAPSGVFYSSLFSEIQRHVSLRFYEIHHHLKVNLPADGGLIAFPSFHVIWAILLTNCARAKKYLFYPLALFNSIIIASTILLGWHYLADVIGGFILAIAGIYITEKWVMKESVI